MDCVPRKDLMKDVLRSVSRSFYLSIKSLPAPMRDAVAVGYLLARATDSVADTARAGVEERLGFLERMKVAIATGDADECARLDEDLRREVSGSQEDEGEKVLLSRFGDCMKLLAALPGEQAALVRRVLATILEGQTWDLVYFRTHEKVEDAEVLRRYAYQVAGCVGEFWTDLGYLVLGDRFSAAPRGLMLKLAREYGEGLQLLNIIRDRAEDAARGRKYLVGSSAPWVQLSRAGLEAGEVYARELHGFRLRFATVLPSLIGQRTHDALKHAENGVKVKISRWQVRGCMVQAACFALGHEGCVSEPPVWVQGR